MLALLTAAAASCLSACAALAQGATSASIRPSFQPARLGSRTAFTLAIRFSGGVEHVPGALSGMVLQMPVGLSINLAGVGICPPSRLRHGGPSACPGSSLLGRGQALLEVYAGSQTLPEEAAVSVWRGPNRGARPTFEILGHGETPLDESTISTAVLENGHAPYGSKLVVSVPPIPTLVYEPNASFISLSLTIGSSFGSRGRSGGSITTPRSCPAGGFPFAAAFTFADHSVAGAAAKLRCP